jgi:hypothetical protein
MSERVVSSWTAASRVKWDRTLPAYCDRGRLTVVGREKITGREIGDDDNGDGAA